MFSTFHGYYQSAYRICEITRYNVKSQISQKIRKQFACIAKFLAVPNMHVDWTVQKTVPADKDYEWSEMNNASSCKTWLMHVV